MLHTYMYMYHLSISPIYYLLHLRNTSQTLKAKYGISLQLLQLNIRSLNKTKRVSHTKQTRHITEYASQP